MKGSVLAALCAAAFTAAVPAQQAPRTLTLMEAEELLVERSLPVAAGRHTVESNEAAHRIAGYRPNPTLQVTADQVPFTSNIPGSVPRFFSTNSDAGANPVYAVQYEQLLERGNKRALRQLQAEAVTSASRAQVLDTVRQQLLALRQAFTAALLAKSNLRLAEDTDAQYAETEKIMEIRHRSGDVALVDLDRIKAARLSYRQAILDARSAYWQACRDVQTSLNLAIPVEAAGALSHKPVGTALAALQHTALEERPDLAAARRSEVAAGHGTRLAEAQRTRDITVAMNLQRVGNDHAVGATASVPLFLFNNNREAVRQATAQQRLANVQVRQAELNVQAEVEKAHQALRVAQQSLDLYNREAVERTARIREVILYSYQRGEASILEVLEAQRNANQIQTSFNQSMAAYESAYWQLEFAVGGRL